MPSVSAAGRGAATKVARKQGAPRRLAPESSLALGRGDPAAAAPLPGRWTVKQRIGNEVLVHRFLSKEISWKEIGEKLKKLMNSHLRREAHTIADILDIDCEGRRLAKGV
jgi:hypothetical protein